MGSTVKVWVEYPDDSRGLLRVYDALIRHPYQDIEFVPNRFNADVVILHVIGRVHATTRRTVGHVERGQKVILIQYSLRRTLTPDTHDWISLWNMAHLVWSYYDLYALCEEDGIKPEFKFYHSPLGVDSKVFYPRDVPKKYIVATSGLSYLTESVRECAMASGDQKVFHVGPNLGDPKLDYSNGMEDDELAVYYSSCKYVSGLRRTEGFEFPGVEGMLCGARPIYFDRPHYRHWFDDLALFVDETNNREDTIEALKEIFSGPYKPMQWYELELARNRFDWRRILEGLWEKIC